MSCTDDYCGTPLRGQKVKQVKEKQNSPPKSIIYSALKPLQLVDIGANLTTDCYSKRRKYIGGFVTDDFIHVLSRAVNAGVRRIMITGTDLSSTKEALSLVKKYPGLLTTTVGFHPTSTSQLALATDNGTFDSIVKEMTEIAIQGAKDGSIVAIGECGYDFNVDRLKFSDEETQRMFFPLHLDLAVKTGLPLFLHNRESNDALFETLTRYADRLTSLCVHSYDGGVEFMQKLLELPCHVYIGLNGCSLRSEEGLAVARAVPLDRLLIETDAPYCGIKKSHPSYQYIDTHWPTKKSDKYVTKVETLIPSADTTGIEEALAVLEEDIKSFTEKYSQSTDDEGNTTTVDVTGFVESSPREERALPILLDGRVEPCHVLQVLEVICNARQIDIETTADQIYQNSMKCFFPTNK